MTSAAIFANHLRVRRNTALYPGLTPNRPPQHMGSDGFFLLPLARTRVAADILERAARDGRVHELGEVTERGDQVLSLEQVIGAWKAPNDGLLIEGGSIPLAVIQALMRQPRSFYTLDPRQFEHVTAEILALQGFHDVRLTPRSGDGGKDVIASQILPDGTPVTLYYECKLRGEGKHVKLAELRAFLMTVNERDSIAAKGVLVTTGRFTAGGRKYIAEHAQLDGKDYAALVEWLNRLKL
jgi:hypothetical protein